MRRSWSTVLLAAAVLAGCSSGATVSDVSTSAPDEAAPTSVAAPGAPAAPGSVPDSAPADTPTGPTLPVIGGGTFDLTRLERGPVALWFWAPG